MRLKLVILAMVTIFSTGCTHIVSSNERSVIVESQSLNAADAQKLADDKCAEKKRVAIMTTKGDYWDRNYVFNCVLSDLPANKADDETIKKTNSQKLRELQALKNDGLISDEEYQKKRTQLIEQL
jgi:hypothetical protein